MTNEKFHVVLAETREFQDLLELARRKIEELVLDGL